MNNYSEFSCLIWILWEVECECLQEDNIILSNSATDINECDEGSDTCQVGVEECVNTQGGHTCQPKPCPIGRKRHPSNPRRCTGEHFQRFEHR